MLTAEKLAKTEKLVDLIGDKFLRQKTQLELKALKMYMKIKGRALSDAEIRRAMNFANGIDGFRDVMKDHKEFDNFDRSLWFYTNKRSEDV